MNSICKSVLFERQLCACHRNVFTTIKQYIEETPNTPSQDRTSEETKRRLKGKPVEMEEPKSIQDITVPTTCCMSGCANCVWIEYAEKLSKFVEKSNVDMQKLIIDQVEDPNMRAFLSMELRCRNLLK